MPTINIADKATLDTINSKIDIVDGVVDNIYSKVDTEIATLTTNLATVDTVADNIYAKVDTEVASIVSATAENSTANKTGTLSQKDAYIISLLENGTYGLNALKSALGSGSSVIKSVQRGTITIASGNTTGTATISAVNTAKTFVIHNGNTEKAEGFGSAQYPKVWESLLTLTNSTTVTATKKYSAGDVIVAYEVVEFY